MLRSAEISGFQKKKVVTFELCMLTFDLGWPPFCRKKRFFLPSKVRKFRPQVATKQTLKTRKC